MRRSLRWLVANRNTLILLAIAVGVISAPLGAGAGPGNSGYIRRFSAQFRTFGTPAELVTEADQASGGLVIYDKDFFTADDINTLYVTISAVGDVHDGARMHLSCELDGAFCNPGPNPIGGSIPGWVTTMRHENYNDDYTGTGYGGDGGGGAGDVHDNVVYYTWCTAISGSGTHNVKVRMASSPSPDFDDPTIPNAVFLEGVHFFVDGSRIADEAEACTEASPGHGLPA